jgi:beta-lactamase class C
MIYYLFSAILFLFSTLFSENVNPQDEKTYAFLQNVRGIIDEDIRKFQIPGIAVAFFDGEHEYFLSFGFADRKKNIAVDQNTIFKIASITKVFTSTLLAVNVIDGKVRLSDSVSAYLKTNGAYINKVSLLNLATHTSSLPRVVPNFDHGQNYTKQQIFDFLNNWRAAYPIGSKYGYSNLGFGILGMALEAENNLSYMKLLETLVLKPLNMNSTFIDVPTNLQPHVSYGYNNKGQVQLTPVNHLTPGSGALYSTADDMMKFLKANLGIEGPKRLQTAMEYTQKDFFKVDKQLSIGLGWQRFTTKDGLLIIDKNGGLEGFSSYIGFTKGSKTGIVILVNKRAVNATDIGRKILSELHKTHP